MPHAAPSPFRLAWRASVLPLGLALAAVLTYVRALDHPFVYDDVRTVVTNASLTDPFDWRRILWHDVTRPVVNASYALDHALWGLSPRGFHLTGALLHALAVLLLYAWTKRLVEDTGATRPVHLCARCAASASGLLFAVHPAVTQAVGYASGRSEVLCAVFFLASLLQWRRFVLYGGLRPLAWGAVAWVASIASKEVGAMLPLVLGAWAWSAGALLPAARRRAGLLVGALVGVAAIAAGVRLGVLWLVEHPRDTVVYWSHLLVMPEVVLRYVGLMLWPMHLSVFHAVSAVASPWSVRFIGPVTLLAASGATAWWARRREPALAVSLAWVLLLVAPSGVLFVADLGEPLAEQRAYLAGAGVIVAVGVGYAWAREWLRARGERAALVAPVGVAVIAIGLFLATQARLDAWRSAVVLWSDAEAKAPGAWVPPLMLGDALDEEGRTTEAADAYARSANARGDQPMTWVKLGIARASAGDVPGAERALQRALALDPRSVEASNALGAIAMTAGRSDEARRRFEHVLTVDASNLPARQLLAALDEQAGRPEDARRRCLEIEAMAPGTPGVLACVERNGRGSDGAGR